MVVELICGGVACIEAGGPWSVGRDLVDELLEREEEAKHELVLLLELIRRLLPGAAAGIERAAQLLVVEAGALAAEDVDREELGHAQARGSHAPLTASPKLAHVQAEAKARGMLERGSLQH